MVWVIRYVPMKKLLLGVPKFQSNRKFKLLALNFGAKNKHIFRQKFIETLNFRAKIITYRLTLNFVILGENSNSYENLFRHSIILYLRRFICWFSWSIISAKKIVLAFHALFIEFSSKDSQSDLVLVKFQFSVSVTLKITEGCKDNLAICFPISTPLLTSFPTDFRDSLSVSSTLRQNTFFFSKKSIYWR